MFLFPVLVLIVFRGLGLVVVRSLMVVVFQILWFRLRFGVPVWFEIFVVSRSLFVVWVLWLFVV